MAYVAPTLAEIKEKKTLTLYAARNYLASGEYAEAALRMGIKRQAIEKIQTVCSAMRDGHLDFAQAGEMLKDAYESVRVGLQRTYDTPSQQRILLPSQVNDSLPPSKEQRVADREILSRLGQHLNALVLEPDYAAQGRATSPIVRAR